MVFIITFFDIHKMTEVIMVKNTGLSYEIFVQKLQQSIINSENSLGIKQVLIEHNKIITDIHGNKRQFDLYWEFEFAGNIYKTIIECKDYSSPITIDKIDAFIGKTQDIQNITLIYATKTGYQSGAKKKAQAHNIRLLIVKEAEDQDWINNDGTPLINKIKLEITAITSPHIYTIQPTLDKTFIETKNINIDTMTQILSRQLNIDLYIRYATDNKIISFFDLANELPSRIKNMQYGKNSYEEEHPDFYLEVPAENFSVKMQKYKINYQFNEPRTSYSMIDISNQLLGIIKDVTNNNQFMIFRDGTIK